MSDAMVTRINEVSDDIIGVYTALLNARGAIGDQHLKTFLGKVPEKGEALWLRFKAFQQEKRDEGAKIEMTFNHFIASVVMPHPLR